jgi:hypothetical protein
MSRARLLLLCLVGALSVVAVSAASASAKISFEWFVNGTLLKGGEKEAFTSNNDGNIFDFHSRLAGSALLLLSTEVTTEGGTIFGGSPGTNEEVVVFKNVTADFPIAGCTVESLPNPVAGTVRTSLLKTEIVEGENGEVLILFTPKTGAFTTLLLLKKGTEACTPANIPTNVEGNILGLPLPQRTSVLRQNIVFPSKESNFFLVNGTLDTSGLKFGVEPATLQGLTLVVLNSDLPWGPF